jgi:hypothetical protein
MFKAKTQPATTQAGFDLIAIFDELAANQPDELAAILRDVGVPADGLQPALTELAVALAGMRNAVQQSSTRLANLLEADREYRETTLPDLRRQALLANLQERIYQLPRLRKEAEKKNRTPPTIDERAERQRIDEEVQELTLFNQHQTNRDLAKLRAELAHRMGAEVRRIVQPYLDCRDEAQRRMHEQCQQWVSAYITRVDVPTPAALARFAGKPAPGTLGPNDARAVVQPDGSFRLEYLIPQGD